MYVLSWTANVDNLNSQATELVIDGSAKAWAYADTAGSGDGDYGSSSQTIVVKVRILFCKLCSYWRKYDLLTNM